MSVKWFCPDCDEENCDDETAASYECRTCGQLHNIADVELIGVVECSGE